MIFNNLYASLSSPNLVQTLSTQPNSPSPQRKDPKEPSKDHNDSKHLYEYEDVLREKNNINYSISDILARASDVMVSNKITPKTEYNGFAIHLLSICFLLIWLTWSFFPKTLFHFLGIYYYPDRWWQLAIPSFVLIAMCYIYIGLALYNIEIKSLPLEDIRNIVDEHAVVSSSFEYYKQKLNVAGDEELIDLDEEKFLWTSTNGVWDLPITTVSKVLYSDYDNYN